MRGERSYRFYSAMRVNCQKLVWRSVIPTIERNLEDLNRRVAGVDANGGGQGGSVTLDPDVETPPYVANHDVHLMPGCYHTEYGDGDVAAGALYDNGGAVFSMGLFGSERDDIGASIARFIALKFPELRPRRILDMGCSIGSNTLPWARTFPEAEVHAVDVAAPMLRYAHARAEALGARVHYRQMDASQCDFGDEPGFDIVWSSMFLHELPPKKVHAVFREAYRLLRPARADAAHGAAPELPHRAVRELLFRLGQLLQPGALLQGVPRHASDRLLHGGRLRRVELRGIHRAQPCPQRRRGTSGVRIAGRYNRGREHRTSGAVDPLVLLRRLEVGPGPCPRIPPETRLRDLTRGKQPRFFDVQGVDELVSITMGLAQELWAVRERLAAVEALGKAGIGTEAVEAYEFSDEERAALDRERKEFIERIYFVLREGED